MFNEVVAWSLAEETENEPLYATHNTETRATINKQCEKSVRRVDD